ncbi:NADP-dependent 3-hydroxy acid dehydrogenase YdfG [Mesorhizobium albiziae]|uniref:NADP-dependent 3-hydroxy acid dehydrogenase YdfG n=1 Tax=Neomesorhizobium albiziae TaxID=335020 RepID=A0A1I3UZV2_9HYPH|nr:SDR family NAD(P)-dependent oxidoreductase [Mesorhizobium albiziae]GLS28554.1 oxidoreductase [Mesorhizobium albiziae]SFJ88203.1 NADP-dependent 3-hydroxy acid dehydrogenase YdfG [Mesorhizobium albiziae]
MGLYRALPEDGVAWVTGASKGIGRQVALDLARQGYTVAATARNAERLAALADEVSGLKGRIVAFPGDVTDEKAMLETVAAIEERLGAVVLAVLNAGAYYPARGDALEVANFVKTYQINLFGVLHGLVPLIDRMRERERGQIALMGSVSAYGGLPMAAAYGASKAALNNMAEALKFDLDKMNIRLQVINPGFVETPLTNKNNFAMPALISVEKASARIVEGLRTGGFEVAFPRRFAWFLKFVNLFPHPAYFWFLNWAMGWRKRPLGPARRSRKISLTSKKIRLFSDKGRAKTKR